jgi:hypothetical protein
VALGLCEATWRTIITEAKCLQASDDVNYITKVFQELNSYVEEAYAARKHEIIDALSDANIFPIKNGRSGAKFDYMSSAQDLDMWFIADRLHLKESFDGLIPLLALEVDVVEKISMLISNLGLSNRLLTIAAGSDIAAEGSTQLHVEFTTSFRAKTHHIARLVFSLSCCSIWLRRLLEYYLHLTSATPSSVSCAVPKSMLQRESLFNGR